MVWRFDNLIREFGVGACSRRCYSTNFQVGRSGRGFLRGDWLNEKAARAEQERESERMRNIPIPCM